MIKFSNTNMAAYADKKDWEAMKDKVEEAHAKLHEKTGLGNDYLGWLDLPANISRDEIKALKDAAAKIRKNSDVLVVIGIGGSYLGTKAGLGMLGHEFPAMVTKRVRKGPHILFAGNNMSSDYFHNLMQVLEKKNFSLNVISKSGTTTEPAIAFRLLKNYMSSRYSEEEVKERIYVTTDAEDGVLRHLSDKEGYESFITPGDIGGRFSVLTPVGLLPLAVAGIDIDKIVKGARDAMLLYRNPKLEYNDAYMYAASRNILLSKGFNIEAMANFEPGLHFMTEWWKQLFGESEGKDGKGIFPVGLDYTTDLHSMGQYVQDGQRILFETVINVEKTGYDIQIPLDEKDFDGLNYLAGKSLDYANKGAMNGTIQAHVDGKVPGLMITIPEMSPYWFGQLVYFFEKACGLSGYILGVNPFDQPGVEEYKKNMFKILGKPGY